MKKMSYWNWKSVRSHQYFHVIVLFIRHFISRERKLLRSSSTHSEIVEDYKIDSFGILYTLIISIWGITISTLIFFSIINGYLRDIHLHYYCQHLYSTLHYWYFLLYHNMYPPPVVRSASEVKLCVSWW